MKYEAYIAANTDQTSKDKQKQKCRHVLQKDDSDAVIPLNAFIPSGCFHKVEYIYNERAISSCAINKYVIAFQCNLTA